MKKRHRILIVDDDADDREIIKDAFEHVISEQDYIFLENGEKLMEHLQTAEDHIKFILLDLNMPGKDGRETLREIKTNKRYQHIPTIVFTTSSSPRDSKMAYELGANCFITKPDTFDAMIQLAKCIVGLSMAW